MVACAFFFAPQAIWAWGGNGHFWVARAGIDNLPQEMYDDGSGNAFGDWADFFMYHGTKPDALKWADSLESRRHYCALDSQVPTVAYPYSALPRSYDAYVDEVGSYYGVIQWEGIEEHVAGLTQAFRARNWTAVYAVGADLAHYVGDDVAPFHTTTNIFGQQTGNDGVKDRQETGIVDRFIPYERLTTRRSANPLGGSVSYVSDRVEFAFNGLLGAHAHLPAILQADNVARAIDPTYGEAYYARFDAEIGDETLLQLNRGGEFLADLLYTAWVDAGRPNFDPEPVAIEALEINPTIDGNLAEFAGGSVFQTNTTDWGDNASELDQMFINRSEDYLLIGVAGNLSFSHAVVILFDTVDGGQTTLNVTVGPEFLQGLSGRQFDERMTADYLLAFSWTAQGFELHCVDLHSQVHTLLGRSSDLIFPLGIGGGVGFDNTNTGGVRDRGGRTITDAESVRTGIEIAIPMSSLGLSQASGGTIDTVALLTNTSADTLISNQTLPGFPLGEFDFGHSDQEFGTEDIGVARFRVPGNDLAAEMPTGFMMR